MRAPSSPMSNDEGSAFGDISVYAGLALPGVAGLAEAFAALMAKP